MEHRHPRARLARLGLFVLSSTGASLTGVTAIAFVAAFESELPSLALNSIARDVPGLSLELLKPTDRSAVW